MPFAAVVALTVAGQPGLRTEYRYRGTWERPAFKQCEYVLLDGSRHELRLPFPQLNACPFIRAFPFNPFGRFLK